MVSERYDIPQHDVSAYLRMHALCLLGIIVKWSVNTIIRHTCVVVGFVGSTDS